MRRDDLEAAYDAAGSVTALGRQLGVTRDQARHRLAKAGIPTRRVGYRNPEAGLRRYGPEQPNWKAIADLPPDLARLYDEAGSIRALARHLGVTWLTVAAWLKRAGIATRRCGFKAPRTGTLEPGAEHPTWQTGTPTHPKGYIYQYALDHPAAARCKGYVFVHRLAMEATLGRLLAPHEHVRHATGDKHDTCAENLVLIGRPPRPLARSARVCYTSAAGQSPWLRGATGADPRPPG